MDLEGILVDSNVRQIDAEPMKLEKDPKVAEHEAIDEDLEIEHNSKAGKPNLAQKRLEKNPKVEQCLTGSEVNDEDLEIEHKPRPQCCTSIGRIGCFDHKPHGPNVKR